MLAAHWKTVILQFNTSKHKVVMQLVLLCFNGEANYGACDTSDTIGDIMRNIV